MADTVRCNMAQQHRTALSALKHARTHVPGMYVPGSSYKPIVYLMWTAGFRSMLRCKLEVLVRVGWTPWRGGQE